MRFHRFLGICCALSFGCYLLQAQAHLEIQIPSVQQEATSVWRTINDIAFFEQQGYQVNLPKGALIDSLVQKSKEGDFGNEDFSTIYGLLEAGAYDKADYQAALAKVEAQEWLLQRMLIRLDSLQKTWAWGFKLFDEYPVVFTLYGSGGSYDPDEGSVLIFTTPSGKFKNYENPANTVIHEIVHIGIEASIIQRYQVPHALKERLVDLTVATFFGADLPDYRIQNMGETEIDAFLKRREDFENLDEIVEQFLN
ncbi:MAG: hypothetical protein AAF804_00330 [Bacteroidota bacterium]